jgi:hypothetical protein
MRRLAIIAGVVLFLAASAFPQSDRGTITGTVTDPAQAVVPNVPVQARNTVTGVAYEASTSATGNYTISQLPAGSYEISMSAPGFKKYLRSGIILEVAQVLRVDIALEVGASTESVTVSAASTLLNTETGDVRHDIRSEALDDLPILGIGAGQAGSSGIRNPNAMVNLIPGTFYIANSEVRVNGAPDNTQSFRIEGQDASNTGTPGVAAQTQPSVDAIQEVAIQTSNYAAEYGQAGGGVFNVTMKSGGNQFHGSAYDYFVNEVLNANQPFTGTARPRNRRNDYGFTIGGPVWLPHIYNGHDKTFFFFNWEQYREHLNINTQQETVPTAAYRQGDFTTATPPGAAPIGTDPVGRPIFQGEIYDPTTNQTAPSGQVYRDPFPNNTIPQSRFDPIAAKIQSLFPAPTGNGVVNNFVPSIPTSRVTQIPSVKIDQVFGNNGRLSFFWQRTQTTAPISATFGQIDGLPDPLATNLGTFQNAPLYRLNYDYTIRPTLLLHLGGGYRSNYFFVPTVNEEGNVPNYDAAAQLGLQGGITHIFFPPMSGLCANGTVNSCSGQGGMMIFGSASYATNITQVPSFNTSLTWVRGNHTYKFGGEFRTEGYPGHVKANTSGSYAFAPDQTSLPYLNNTTLAGGQTPGFGYASFLLGQVKTISIANPLDPRLGKMQLGLFAQDSWKIKRNLTVDYGLRYDYSTYLQEEHGRAQLFSPTTPNPALGGIPGALIFEGHGPGHCNCELGRNYPYAFAPRLGVAYQINSKTVFRTGFGIIYSGTESNNNANTTLIAVSSNSLTTPSFGGAITTLSAGIPSSLYPPQWPNLDPGQFNRASTTPATTIPVWMDPNAGRPARQYQFSAGIQREIFTNLVLDVSYIGSRGIWWYAPALSNLNSTNPATLAAHGFDITNASDRTVLTGTIGQLLSNPALAAAHNVTLPYAGFPATATVAQALRPFPQFNTILSYWTPLGDTWYDGLQVKATKRFSHGLTFVSTFAKQKTLTIGTERDANPGSSGNALTNNIFNRQNNKYISAYDQPLVFNISLTYTTPSFGKNKILSWIARDWTYGAFLQYSSGLPIQAPYANNNLNALMFNAIPSNIPVAGSTGTFANRVPGVPLYTVDLNCHCYDPNKTFALNPAAWTDPAGGTFGASAAYYNDYRTQRRPSENMNFGRTWRIKEKASFNLRMEFSNIFNRALWNNPTAINAAAPQVRQANGNTQSGGFGYMNTTTFSQNTGPNILPRQGVLVARFTF